MLINYKDVALLKSLMDGTATKEDIFYLNNLIEDLEEQHAEFMEKRNQLDKAILASIKKMSYNYGVGKTASEIVSDVNRDLRTEISLPMVVQNLRRLVSDGQVQRIEDKNRIAARVNYYGKHYIPEVVFVLATGKED